MMHDFSRKSYLVIDDFADMRAAIRSILRSLGVGQVDQARDGNDAIQQMAHKRYDVVLCDYNLGPGKDGQQVLEEARHRELIGVDAIFVMITAENTREMVMGAAEYAPDNYLAKPFTKELLKTRLERLFDRKADLGKVNRALRTRDFAAALAELTTLIAAKPRNLGELLKLKAETCIKAGRYDEASSIYEEILAERELVWARLGQGKIHFLKRRYLPAEQVFTQLIAQDASLIQAHDWLAKTQMALKHFQDAEKTLKEAAKLSPRGLKRQQLLGDVALSNGNTPEAEAAYGRAVSLAKHSVLNHPSLFSGLAKAKSASNKHGEATKVIADMSKTFSGDPEAAFYVASSTAFVKQAQGDAESAKSALAQAESALRALGGNTQSSRLSLEMAKTYAQLGEKEKAANLLQKTIANNHDEDEFLSEIIQACREADLDYDAEAAIREIQQNVVKTNNEGVRLIKEGDFTSAIGLLAQAAEEMQENKTINLNAAKAIIMKMEKMGPTKEELLRVRAYVERVQHLAPDDWRLADVVARLGQLSTSLA